MLTSTTWHIISIGLVTPIQPPVRPARCRLSGVLRCFTIFLQHIFTTTLLPQTAHWANKVWGGRKTEKSFRNISKLARVAASSAADSGHRIGAPTARLHAAASVA